MVIKITAYWPISGERTPIFMVKLPLINMGLLKHTTYISKLGQPNDGS